jgi:dynein heavy chain
MNELEKIVLAFAEGADTIHPDFRLFLTSMPAPYFPVSVLQNSVKVTTEPPKGLKANLKRTYTAMNQEFLDKCSKPEVWRKLLFCLSFNHAILQERRKFGPLGFNIRYEFNDSDLHTTFTMLQLFLDTQDEVAWDALTFVTGHINYGGRVTDDNDRICLLRTLHKYCNPEAIRDGYMFSSSGIYYAPKDGSYQSYMDYIETFPLNDHPEVFGLHTNANINSMETDSLNNVNTILEIQPRLIGGGGGLTPDEVVIQKSAGLLERLPELLDPRDALEGLFAKNELGLIPSLSTVLA